MKRNMKFFAMMIMAGAMLFCACKKDEEESNDTPVSKCPVQVTFDGKALGVDECMTQIIADDEDVVVAIAAAKKIGDPIDFQKGWVLPVVAIALQPIENQLACSLSEIGLSMNKLDTIPEWDFDRTKPYQITDQKIELASDTSGFYSFKITASLYSTAEVNDGKPMKDATHKDISINVNKLPISQSMGPQSLF